MPQPAVLEILVVPRLERAIGVIHRPQSERTSLWVPKISSGALTWSFSHG